ncbi:MAG: MBL fold metallo-hydrolase [Afipia sp.]|nr:MBL fold metallo-hydrolase [Afipia sp.]
MANPLMTVRIWGARGSIPAPGPETVRYGGNTSCVEVICGNRTVVFDAGSGLRLLGNQMMRDNKIADIDLFLSHCHIDHLIGLPFFTPLFEKTSRVRLWAGNVEAAGGLKETIHKMMSYPLFPIEIEMAQGKIDFNDFEAGDILTPQSGIIVRTAELNHPGGAIGYRLEHGGKAIAYITDTELNGSAFDSALLGLAKDAALLIIDSTYTDDELPQHVGWGHSSWQQTVSFADAAGVKQLCLYHHDPEHDDTFMDQIASAAVRLRPGTTVAREGMTIEI